jgi:Flp pilus assembly protein TadG
MTMKMLNDRHKQAVALICAFDSAAPASKASCKFRLAGKQVRVLLHMGDSGQELAEFALILPLLLAFMMGIFSIGSAFEHHQALWQAVGIGAQQLSQSRDSSSDPCADVFAAITGAAPNLVPGSIGLTVTMNGVAVTGNSCAGSKSAMGLAKPGSVTVVATYPCSVKVYGATIAPITCTATSTQREF